MHTLSLFLAFQGVLVSAAAAQTLPGPPGAPGGVSPIPKILTHPGGVGAGSRFGVALCVLDFDRDGRLDLAVGAPGNGTTQLGQVWVYRGPTFALADALQLTSSNSEDGDHFGDSLASGDLDGDGHEELIIGAPSGDWPGQPKAGYVSVWDGGATPSERAVLRMPIPQAGANFGRAVAVGQLHAAAGAEVVASAPHADLAGFGSSGEVHLFSVQSGVSPAHLAELVNPDPAPQETQYGHRLEVGDWTGDGRQDLLVGAIFNDASDCTTTWLGAGRFYVYRGAVASLAAPILTIDNPTPESDFPLVADCGYQRFGMHSAAGDLDGDGHLELVVGTPRKDLGGAGVICDTGSAYLFSGATPPACPQNMSPYRWLAHPTPRNKDLTGYRVLVAQLTGGPELDVGVALLANSSSSNLEALLVFDGADVATVPGGSPSPAPAAALLALPDSASHWCDGLVAGNLSGLGGYDDVAVGDRDWGPTSSNLTGRVVIYWVP